MTNKNKPATALRPWGWSTLLLFLLLCQTAWTQIPVFQGTSLDSGSERISAQERDALAAQLDRTDRYALDPGAIHAFAVQAEGTLRMRIVLGEGHDWDLVLEPFDLRAPGYHLQVANANGIGEGSPVASTTYRGHVNGEPDQWARFSIREEALLGYVKVGDEEWYLEPIAHFNGGSGRDDRYVVYRAQDLLSTEGASCGVAHMRELEPESEPMQRGGNPCRLAPIAIAADASMVAFLGSAEAVETRILDILNWIDAKYQEPEVNIAYQLVSLFISETTDSDPWNPTVDASTLLVSFRNWGNGGGFGATYAVASLWTRRNIESNGNSGTVGLAYVGVVCTNNRYNICQHYTTNMAGPTVVQTHELGHNWNAPHTSDPGQWIMAPTANVNNTNWNSGTINIMVAFKNTRTCLGTSCTLLPLAAFTTANATSCDGTVAFTDLSVNEPDNWLWDFGDGNTSTEQNPVHTYTSSGSYDVTLSVENDLGTDVIVQPGLVVVELLDAPTTTDAVVCDPGGPVELSASGVGDLLWYDEPEGGEPVFVGDLFATVVANTTSWYVESSTFGPLENVGAEDNNIGSGEHFAANDNWGLRFDVFETMVLRSVKVFANSGGTRTIHLLDNASNLIAVRTVSMPPGESRVTLDLEIPPGSQYLLKLTGSTLGLFRNDGGASFPYSINGLVTITETNALDQGASNYWYYFYDWEVQAAGCASSRSEATAVVQICASVDEVTASAFLVYPNPSEGQVHVEWDPLRSEAPDRFVVFDALGRRISEQRNTAAQRATLDLHAAPGIYFLRVLGSDGALLDERRLVVW
jgi:PKD repeat protein